MGQDSGAPSKTAACVGYMDNNLRCLDSSTTSRAAWLKSLNLGCLNKSVGDKLRAYSQIQALSAKLHEPLTHDQAPYLGQNPRTARKDVTEIDENVVEYKLEKDAENGFLSVVILEDYSRPPQTTDKLSPLLFTSAEFFEYIYSDSWSENISLRVVGGVLLDQLCTALYILERDYLVNCVVIPANMNNRFKLPVADKSSLTSTAGECCSENESVRKARELLPNPYEPKKEFTYEKMNVEIVFYEKLDSSNIPYIIQDTDIGDDKTIQKPIPREVLRPPYALIEHKMNYVRLPASEDLSTLNSIEKLIAELEVLKDIEAQSKDQPPIGAGSEKLNAASDKVEMIAEDPFLVKEHSFDLPEKKSMPIRIESSNLQKITQQKRPSIGKIRSSLENAHVIPSDAILEIQPLESESKVSSFRTTQLDDSCRLSSSYSQEQTYFRIKSPSEILSEEEDEPVLKRLNLTRNELYVTDMYYPRNANSVCTKEKLNHIRQLRVKIRSNKERSIYQKLKENTPFDISDRFKHLAGEKECARRIATASRVERKIKILDVPKPVQLRSWDNYFQDQEEIEEDSALINDLEKGILQRLLADPESKTEDKKVNSQDVKNKSGKNKNKNNPDNTETSVIQLDGSEKRSASTRLYNSNTNSIFKTGAKCSHTDESNWKLKFPIIQNTPSSARNELKGKISIVLPPLRNEKRSIIHKETIEETEKNKIIYRGQKSVSTSVSRRKKNTEDTAKLKTTNNSSVLVTRLKTTLWKQEMLPKSHSQSEVSHKVQNKKYAYFNQNQNQSVEESKGEIENGKSAEEANLDTLENNVVELSQEGVNSPNIVVEADRTEKPKPASDHYTQRLLNYRCECSCLECNNTSTEYLYGDNEADQMADYPPYLGRLRQDFRFLKYADYNPKQICTPPSSAFDVSEVNHQFVCDNILKMMDTIMVRKEILTSSLGDHTYITITFTRKR